MTDNPVTRILTLWDNTLKSCNACKLCIHGKASNGTICTHTAAGIHSQTTNRMRLYGHACGPEAALMELEGACLCPRCDGGPGCQQGARRDR